MALLDPEDDGPPNVGARYTLRAAGAESNVAIGLMRLGVRARWVSKLGQDELGAAVYAAPDAELEGVRLVHLTGITLALSGGCRELVINLARRARERGALVQFDPNFR